MQVLDNKDFWAGLVLIAIGTATVLIARNYAFGSTLRMGPGYFPTVLGGLLVLFGLYLAIDGLRRGDRIGGHWSLRALVVLPLAFVAFGVLMSTAGFVPALLALIVGSALASPQFRLLEVLLLSVVLTAIAVALFVFGLGLPYPLFTGS
jgi:hypothetical protein